MALSLAAPVLGQTEAEKEYVYESLKAKVAESNAMLPKELMEGMKITKIELTDKAYTTIIEVSNRIFPIQNLDMQGVKNGIVAQIKSTTDPMHTIAVACAYCGLNITFVYKYPDINKKVEVTVTPTELKQLIR